MQMFALHYPFSDHDIMDEIRKEEAIENAKRRKARKERARDMNFQQTLLMEYMF